MASKIKEFAYFQIRLEEIRDATNNFADKNIIGKGGFGNVYRGKLIRDGNVIKISARRLTRKYGQGDVEFWTEISMLSSLEYDNLVSMIGFCDEKGEKIIVYDHYPKGSLLMYLNDPKFTWKQRLDISFDITTAIHYIHEGTGHGDYVIHRNINSSTILLDKNWNPKLSGFEFAIKHSIDRRNEFLLSEAIGTRGYIDPAIEKYGGVNCKSDIYSLGVVLFEILCGRKANEGNSLLAPLAKFHYENGTLQDIIHPDLWNQMDTESFESFSKAAYSCLEEDPALRTDAYQVMMALTDEQQNDFPDYSDEEDAVQVPITKKFDDAIECASCDPSKVKKWEHLRIEEIDITLALRDYSVFSNGHDDPLIKTKLKCFDREYISSVEGMNKDKLPQRYYTVKMKTTREDMVSREIEILSSCKHPNVECLLGFFKEGLQTMVVYEYASEKYLYGCLDDGNLTWEKRLKICIDVAHGLDYLHNEMEEGKRVIHRDINSKNIELNDISGAKIVGFENSVFLPQNQDDDVLYPDEIVWDQYYTDPEYAENGTLKRESDVFSFGVVMFEILCGMCAVDVIKNESCKNGELADLARRWFDEGTMKKKLCHTIKNETHKNSFSLSKGPNEDSLNTFCKITYQCLAETQNQRPRTKVIIEELQRALSFHENHKDPLKMSYEDIKLATQDFSRANCIGVGGFGGVYKGNLVHENGYGHYTIVAKKLDKSHGQGEKQYYNELQILYEYRHDNVIGLVGYSNETDEKLIVYEHASKGSLDKYLNRDSLTWSNRLSICIDVATGLDFLHGGVLGQEVVIHRDIKTANILLFDDWKAKIGDFGLSLISTINKETDFIIDHACGTRDYVDPMYLKSGFLTVESDIYSLGVVLFEILCGRAVYAIPKNGIASLLSFIKHNFEDEKQNELVFKAIKEDIMPKSLTTFLSIVYKCLDDDREKRPTSKEVSTQLHKALEFQS